MNITFQYNINDIDELNYLPITFIKDNNLKHIDSVYVQKDINGYVDQNSLNSSIENLHQKVIAKQEFINWT